MIKKVSDSWSTEKFIVCKQVKSCFYVVLSTEAETMLFSKWYEVHNGKRYLLQTSRVSYPSIFYFHVLRNHTAKFVAASDSTIFRRIFSFSIDLKRFLVLTSEIIYCSEKKLFIIFFRFLSVGLRKEHSEKMAEKNFHRIIQLKDKP